MAKFKELYVFDVYKKKEVEEIEQTKDAAGNDIEIKKKVIKDAPVKIP